VLEVFGKTDIARQISLIIKASLNRCGGPS